MKNGNFGIFKSGVARALALLSLGAAFGTSALAQRFPSPGPDPRPFPGRPDTSDARQRVQELFYLLTGSSGSGFVVESLSYDLATGFRSQSEIRREIAYNYSDRALSDIYFSVLDRSPDFGGLETYRRALADSWSLREVRRDIAYSQEAANGIDGIYRELLNRSVDAGGLSTYQSRLREGYSLQWVRNDVRNSEEYRRIHGG